MALLSVLMSPDHVQGGAVGVSVGHDEFIFSLGLLHSAAPAHTGTMLGLPSVNDLSLSNEILKKS